VLGLDELLRVRSRPLQSAAGLLTVNAQKTADGHQPDSGVRIPERSEKDGHRRPTQSDQPVFQVHAGSDAASITEPEREDCLQGLYDF
jgi:hypothetical protein